MLEVRNLLKAGRGEVDLEILDEDADELGVKVLLNFGEVVDDSTSWFNKFGGLTGGAGFFTRGVLTGDPETFFFASSLPASPG